MSRLPTESMQSYNSVTDEWTLTFVWPDRIMTTNTGIRGSWHAAAKFTAEWREAFRLMSTGCPALRFANVKVQYVHASDRKMDVGAEALAVKAAIDGVVDGGVLPDDNPLFVRSVLTLAPMFVDGVEMLILELTGPPALDDDCGAWAEPRRGVA